MKRIINENTRTTWKEWSCSKREVRLLQVNFRGNKMYCKLVHPTTFSIQIKKLLWKNKFSILAEKEWSLKKKQNKIEPIQFLSVQKCFFLVKMRNGLLFKNRFNRTRQKRNDLARNGVELLRSIFFWLDVKLRASLWQVICCWLELVLWEFCHVLALITYLSVVIALIYCEDIH